MYNIEDGIKHIREFTVGSQDVDGSGRIRPSRLAAYLQEAGDSHLRSYGVDYKTMHDEGHQAFIVSRFTVEYITDVMQYDNIKVRTWFDEGKGVNYPRSYDALVDGKPAVRAYSNWGLIDLESGRFVRFSDHIYSNGPFEPNVELEMPERFRIPKELELEPVFSFDVRHSMTDMNNHMNNVMYIDPMWDAIPDVESRRIGSFSIRFVHESLLGDRLTVLRSELISEDGRDVIYFRIVSGDEIRAEGRWTVR